MHYQECECLLITLVRSCTQTRGPHCHIHSIRNSIRHVQYNNNADFNTSVILYFVLLDNNGVTYVVYCIYCCGSMLTVY